MCLNPDRVTDRLKLDGGQVDQRQSSHDNTMLLKIGGPRQGRVSAVWGRMRHFFLSYTELKIPAPKTHRTSANFLMKSSKPVDKQARG